MAAGSVHAKHEWKAQRTSAWVPRGMRDRGSRVACMHEGCTVVLQWFKLKRKKGKKKKKKKLNLIWWSK